MKVLRNFIILSALLSIAGALPVDAQTSTERMDANNKRTEKQKRIVETRNRPIDGEMPDIPPPQMTQKLIKDLLEPTIADTTRYGKFLKQSKTGIVRLLKENGCTGNQDLCWQKTLPDKGAFYSFRVDGYSFEDFADLGFKKKYLVSLGILNQGILVELGDEEIETIDISHEGIKFLTDFRPGATLEEADAQRRQFEKGVAVGKYTYKNVLPFKVNTNYALRAVAYRAKVIRTYATFDGEKEFDLLENDKRRDVLIIFRILAEEPDGSITLIWKELKNKDAPRLSDKQ